MAANIHVRGVLLGSVGLMLKFAVELHIYSCYCCVHVACCVGTVASLLLNCSLIVFSQCCFIFVVVYLTIVSLCLLVVH